VAARNYVLFIVAAESGLRVHELCALDLHRDLLFTASRLQTRVGKGFRGSGPRVRQTVFTPFAQATVRHYIEHVRPNFKKWSHSPFLFLSETGNPLTEAAAQYAMRQFIPTARKAELRVPPRFGWHSLRRSFATIFLEENPESAWVLMEMLGHINPSTLHRYVHHTRAYHDRVMDSVISKLIPR
jgi:integrase